MKTFKKIATLCVALSLCIGIAGFAACGGDSNESSQAPVESSSISTPDSSVADSSDDTSADISNPTEAGYHFRLMNADGTPAATDSDGNPYFLQFCVADLCYDPVAVDANGCVTYNPNGFPGAGEYDVHVLGGEWKDNVEFDGIQKTSASYSTEYVVLTLK